MTRYTLDLLILLTAVVLLVGCPGQQEEPFEIGEAVLEEGRVTVEVRQVAGQPVSIGILLVESSPYLPDTDPLHAKLVSGGLRVGGGPVEVIYGELKMEYFPSPPETCREISRLGRNQTMKLPSWVVNRINEGGILCVLATEGEGTKDSPRSEPRYWLRPIRIVEGAQPADSAEQPQTGEGTAGEPAGEPAPAEPGEPGDQ